MKKKIGRVSSTVVAVWDIRWDQNEKFNSAVGEQNILT